MNKVSVLIPTRNRGKLFKKSINSLFESCSDVNNFEVLVALDNDDIHSINEIKEYAMDKPNVKLFFYERQFYRGLHNYYNDLSTKSSGEFLLLWNDDAIMNSVHWDLEILKYKNKFCVISPKVDTMIEFWEKQGVLFPIIPKKWFEVTGSWSQVAACDSWIDILGKRLGLTIKEPLIVISHDRFDVTGNNNDETHQSVKAELIQMRRYPDNMEHVIDQHHQKLSTFLNSKLITGANGLVGSQFTNNSIKLTRAECDLMDKNSVDEYFKTNPVNNVIHCAGKVGGLGGNMKHMGDYFYENLMINTNVIEAARKHGVKNLVCFLSTCIFPAKIEYPLTEDKIHLGPPHESNYGYGYAKRMAEVQIRAYREQHGLNYKCVVPTNIYGPNDDFNIEDGHVIPSLIHKCYIAKRDNTPFTIWGSGIPLREFIYVKDVAKLAEWVLCNYDEDEPIILTTSTEHSIREVVNMIVELMEFDGEVIWDTSKPDGQYRKPSDNSKIKKYLPDFEFTSLRDGLKESIDWFNNNYPDIRT